MPEEGMTLEEILDALYGRLEGLEGEEVEDLKSRPRFQEVIEALVTQGLLSDEARKRQALQPIEAPTVPCPTVQHPLPIPTSEERRASRVVITYNPNHKEHRSARYPMESPERVEAIIGVLGRSGLLDEANVCLLRPSVSSRGEIERVHDPAYVDSIRSYSASGGGDLSRNTYVSAGSWQAALGAAGCALGAAEALHQGQDFALALTRPPGHHAGPDFHGGFCLFNNSALAAQRLREEGRVMILNWDVHASNGTKRLFYSDPGVLTISVHQDPTHFFPGEGFAHEIGTGAGRGYSVNVPMPEGSGDKEYLGVFRALVEPIAQQYAPHWLIVECGFDAHHQDPLGGQRLTSQGYYEMTEHLLSLRKEGILFTLEGGYNAQTIGGLAQTVICALRGEANPFPDQVAKGAVGQKDALSYALVKNLKGAKRKAPSAGMSVTGVIEEVRRALRGYWELEHKQMEEPGL